jgi:cobalt-zinc-cadmium efflux system outer membrane protein
MKRSMQVCVCVWMCSTPTGARAQEGVLTLDGALQRAREQAVPVVSGRFRIEEARARAHGARLLRDNPVLESAVGDRSGGSSSSTDLELGLSQTFELGGRRDGRIAVADAAVALETAKADEARVLALRDVALSFQRAVAAAERVRLAEVAVRHAEEVERIAARRLSAGDVAALDVNLAKGALARSRSELRSARAAAVLALGELRILLDLPPDAPLVPSGDLRPRPVEGIAALLQSAAERPDIAAVDAELRAAEGETAQGRGMRWPEVTPSVRFERDQGTHVLWGGLTLSLPVWNRGQEARAAGEARTARLRAGADALRRSARQEVLSAYEAYGLRITAAEELDDAAARLGENETLARRSYEEGQIGLGELLLVRRESLEVQSSHLERRLAAKELEMELLARAGVWR